MRNFAPTPSGHTHSPKVFSHAGSRAPSARPALPMESVDSQPLLAGGPTSSGIVRKSPSHRTPKLCSSVAYSSQSAAAL